jgi:hypothetical protein
MKLQLNTALGITLLYTNGNRRQLHEANTVRIGSPELVRGCYRDHGLADATRSDDRHEAPVCQLGYQRANDTIAADRLCQLHGEIVQINACSRLRGIGILGLPGTGYGRDESISMPRHVLDIAQAAPRVSQQLTQGGHVYSQCALLDDRLRPHPRDELALSDNLPRVLH